MVLHINNATLVTICFNYSSSFGSVHFSSLYVLYIFLLYFLPFLPLYILV